MLIVPPYAGPAEYELSSRAQFEEVFCHCQNLCEVQIDWQAEAFRLH